MLRKRLFALFFGACGNDVLFGRFINVQNPKQILIGDNVVISDRVTLDAGSTDNPNQLFEIKIDDHVFIGTETVIKTVSAPITISTGTNLGSCCHLLAGIPIDIGRDTLFAAFCRIGSESQVFNNTFKSSGPKGINIRSGCWLGVRVTIENSVNIGKGTIVGAHANVSNDLPEYTIAVGNPARPIKKR